MNYVAGVELSEFVLGHFCVVANVLYEISLLIDVILCYVIYVFSIC